MYDSEQTGWWCIHEIIYSVATKLKASLSRIAWGHISKLTTVTESRSEQESLHSDHLDAN